MLSGMRRLISTGLAGVVATVPMTLFMLAMHRALPRREQYPLPPREITETLVERAGIDEDEKALTATTIAAHFGYGAAAGLPFALARPTPIAGLLYGVVVWTGSYLGLMPALGILRPATSHPARRTALMIVAHLIWGTSLAAVTRRLAGR